MLLEMRKMVIKKISHNEKCLLSFFTSKKIIKDVLSDLISRNNF